MIADTTATVLPPITARELLHYDSATAIALNLYPPLPVDVIKWERLLRAQQAQTYRDLLLHAWSDREHARRMASINGNLDRGRRKLAAERTAIDTYETAVLRGLGL